MIRGGSITRERITSVCIFSGFVHYSVVCLFNLVSRPFGNATTQSRSIFTMFCFVQLSSRLQSVVKESNDCSGEVVRRSATAASQDQLSGLFNAIML